MARIGIDARFPDKTGVGDYTRSLLEYLEEIDPHNNTYYVFVLSKKDSPFQPKKKNFKLIEANFMWHSVSEQTGFARLLNSYKLDLMHFTYFSFPVLYRRPFVITIHDLTPLLFATGKASTKNPLLYGIKHSVFTLVMHTAVRRSKAIIVPSQQVKNDIESYYGIAFGNKITVTYEGVHTGLLRVKEARSASFNLTKPFFLYVGNFYPHKNVQTLIHAFKDVSSDYQLVLVGPDSYFARRMMSLIDSLGLDKKVQFLPSVSDAELVYLFKHAQALIHPSLAEGFGMTLLEASYFECPVIASDIPIFHETMGEHFIPFDPKDEYSIATAIKKFIDHPQKKYLPRKILNEKFSFKRMSHQTYDVYQKILS